MKLLQTPKLQETLLIEGNSQLRN